jgi:1-deoxy-D-xylulose-5-phosphate reductoisomerase
MGKKVTIDSATMMNKALEIIEARWLFGLRADQIGVMVHPQSIIHSLVEFQDGALVAQMGPPDMKLPIQYALTWPEREVGPARRFDWSRAYNLEMTPPDLERFPALELGWRAARDGGTTGAVLNGANEAAVNEFLAGELPFCEITAVARRIVEEHPFEARPTLARLIELDRWAREQVTQRVVM